MSGEATLFRIFDTLSAVLVHLAGGAPIAGIGVSPTPILASVNCTGVAVFQGANNGANQVDFDLAFSFDGITFLDWPNADLKGIVPGMQTTAITLPVPRPPYIRARATARSGTTTVTPELQMA